ncbi:MAG: hypothetical protein JW874_03435 [Spirochaetales bacterium]|nr:hypothetical protein [Spirochaetales bacterium]
MNKMKTLLPVLVLVSLFILSCETAPPPEENKEYPILGKQFTTAVIEFTNKTKYGARRLSDSAGEILTTEMLRSGNFILVERDKIEQVMAELELQLSGITESENAAELGAMLNCQYMLVGSVSSYGVKTTGQDLIIMQKKVQTAECEVDIRVIDVETGGIIFSAYGKGVEETSSGSALGLGSAASYDETLSGKVLRKAITEAVFKLINFFASK